MQNNIMESPNVKQHMEQIAEGFARLALDLVVMTAKNNNEKNEGCIAPCPTPINNAQKVTNPNMEQNAANSHFIEALEHKNKKIIDLEQRLNDGNEEANRHYIEALEHKNKKIIDFEKELTKTYRMLDDAYNKIDALEKHIKNIKDFFVHHPDP
jgi:pyruvate/2-oxoacid:ferredoxin oxidoreductase alpha subunit